MADAADTTESTQVQVLDIPSDKETQIDIITLQMRFVIKALAQQLKRPISNPPPQRAQDLLPRLDMLLNALENDIQITPEIRDRTKIDLGLGLMFKPGPYEFPEEYANRARELYERWEEERWGAGEPAAVEEQEDQSGSSSGEKADSPSAKRRKPNTPTDTGVDKGVKALRLPPSYHPIFGTDGIMHGVVAKRSAHGRRDYVLNPTLTKRSGAVHGSNGLKNGAWFPFQILALAGGAHGAKQAGISGPASEGAYSIVVSGMYLGLDDDRGEEVYYSGSNSLDNEDPQAPPSPTAGTLALQASLQTQKPVRVLRGSRGHSTWAPTVGLRYDGLYRVHSAKYSMNNKGGKYQQFKLVRMEGQPPIAKNIPTSRQMEDFDRISLGY